jgi:hypothetical protein
MKKPYKIGDLVRWTPDDDIGIVTHVDEGALVRLQRNPDAWVDPYWVEWFGDPRAAGWHGRESMLQLFSLA